MAPEHVERKLAAILVADVAGYSRLMGNDETGTAKALRGHVEALRPIIASHGGRIVDTAGDGMLLEFPSVVAAIECAVAAQKLMAERNADLPQDRRMLFRMGINLGDVIVEGERILGDGVNVAARLEALAEPGGICISETVLTHVRDKVPFAVEDAGDQVLKNITRPVHVYRIVDDSRERRPVPRTQEGPALPDKPSIAVLPFQNMSGDMEQEYFADGISEDIITALSKLSQLFVIARNSSFTFKGRNVHISEVGKSLGVRYVLEGSVRKSGGRVRVTAQLIDATTGGHLWAERFDRDLTDIFAVQDDVTANIVASLALNLSSGERQKIAVEHTDNMEAHDCFLRGCEQFFRLTKGANREAETLLKRAVELDPRFAAAHAFLAGTLVINYVNGWSASPAHALEEAEKAARRAVQLDERYPYALWALSIACLWARRYDEAVSTAEKMIAFSPNFAWGHHELGLILHYVGRSNEALKHFERAMALDPYYPEIWLHHQAQTAYMLGRYPEAVGLTRRRILRNPNTDASRALLAASYGQMGRIEEAREAWREALKVNAAFSLEQRRKVLPYKNPQDFDRLVEGLRKAGLPG